LRRKRCYIYTRVSTAAQTEGYSLEAQQQRLHQYAEYKELEIAGEYCDAGKSGKSIKGRPEFQRMMEDVESQKDDISYVLVFKLSRFGRNAADVLKSLQLLLDYEVDLVSVDDAIDSSTQGGRLTLAILSAVAEIERENIAVQFMAGRMQKIKTGGWPGGPIPYGYRKSREGLVQEPEEAEIVAKIYDLYLKDDFGATTIVRYLNDHAYSRTVKNKQKPFTFDFITTILDNPVYCGRILYNRRTNSKDPNRQKKEIMEVLGNHEPIVSREQWEKVHQKRQQNSNRCKKVDEPDRISLLSGLVKCPVCGGGMIASKNKHINKNRGGYYKILHYYCCGNSKKQNGMTCSFRHTYNQEKVDSAVLEMVSDLTMTPSFEKKLMEHFVVKNVVDEQKALLKKTRKELYHQEQQRRKLGEILDNLDVLSDDYSEKYDSILEKIDLVYDRIDELEMLIKKTKRKLDAAEQGIEASMKLKDFICRLPDMFQQMSCEEKREMYRLLIDRIDMYAEKTADGRVIKSISFKFPVFYGDQEPGKDADPDDTVTYTLDASEIGVTVAEAKATYTELKSYILEKYGVKVSSLYIAQIKRKYGIEVGENYNKPADANARVPKCPKAKEEIIVDALKHFRMLDENVEIME
jgi:site-specific DNA recombinase